MIFTTIGTMGCGYTKVAPGKHPPVDPTFQIQVYADTSSIPLPFVVMGEISAEESIPNYEPETLRKCKENVLRRIKLIAFDRGANAIAGFSANVGNETVSDGPGRIITTGRAFLIKYIGGGQ